jgi:hypothetical protein
LFAAAVPASTLLVCKRTELDAAPLPPGFADQPTALNLMYYLLYWFIVIGLMLHKWYHGTLTDRREAQVTDKLFAQQLCVSSSSCCCQAKPAPKPNSPCPSLNSAA